MPCKWYLSSIEHNDLYNEFIAETINGEVYIDGDKIHTDDGKIVIILDLVEHAIEKFNFKNLHIQSIIFNEEEIRITVFSKINAQKGKILNYPKERKYYPINDGRVGKEPLPTSLNISSVDTMKLLIQKCTIDNFEIKEDRQGMELEFSENIFLEDPRISGIEFLKNVSFWGNTFEKGFTASLIKFHQNFSLHISKNSSTNICLNKLNFNGEVFLYGSRFQQLNILNSSFDRNVFFGLDQEVENTQGFGNSVFDQHLYIDNCRFESKIYFERCYFKLFMFSNSSCKNDVFFDYAIFDEIKVSKTTFFQRASFYYVIFNQPPLFANCIFDKHLTMTGAKIELENKKILDLLMKKTQLLSEMHNQIIIGKIVRNNDIKNQNDFINDYRDGFCNIKNALSKNNNNLDASNFHRIELYCKEAELKSKRNKNVREWIDWLQLSFYRHTSDHHTDLLKSFHSLLILVAVFGIMSFGVIIGFDKYLGFPTSSYWENFDLAYQFYSAHIDSIIKNHWVHIFSINLGFIAVFLLLFWISIWKYFRWVFIPLGYAFSIGIFAISPKLLLPAIGLFTDKKSILDPLSIIGGVYTLLFGLLAYSLIKTARKNSIVP